MLATAVLVETTAIKRVSCKHTYTVITVNIATHKTCMRHPNNTLQLVMQEHACSSSIHIQSKNLGEL